MKKELIDIVRKLKDIEEMQDAFIDSMPYEYNSIILDSKYTTNVYMQKDIILSALFGDMVDDVEWFLYAFKAGKSAGPHCVHVDGTEYTFNTNEDYYEYLKDQ